MCKNDFPIDFNAKADKNTTQSSFAVRHPKADFSEVLMEGNTKNIRNWPKLVRTGGVGATTFIRLLTVDYMDFRGDSDKIRQI
jgi:phage antirepressor YoqD-like protein